MRRKPTTPASCEAGEGDAKAVPSANDAGGCGPATATGVKRHRRLSDIGEASHECYSSSSGSSAGTTALAFSQSVFTQFDSTSLNRIVLFYFTCCHRTCLTAA